MRLGNGKDDLFLDGDANGEIRAGKGHDNVEIGGNLNRELKLGAGNDTAIIEGWANAYVHGGKGNDTVELHKGGKFFGNAGNDKLVWNFNNNDLSDKFVFIGGADSDTFVVQVKNMKQFEKVAADINVELIGVEKIRVEKFDGTKLDDFDVIA